jgi:hypothetical protein
VSAAGSAYHGRKSRGPPGIGPATTTTEPTLTGSATPSDRTSTLTFARGMRRRVTDPTGQQYLLQAAPSGYVEWPTYAAQTLVAFLAHTVGTTVARWIFRGGWTLTVWQGDAIAPKRRKLHNARHRTAECAIDAFEELVAEIEHAGWCRATA